MIERLGESRSSIGLVQPLLAGATGPTAAISLERLLEGGPVRLNVHAPATARTFFYSQKPER